MQPHHMTDDEFLHALSLRDDPIARRMVQAYDEADSCEQRKAVEEFEERHCLDFIQDADIVDRLMMLGAKLDGWCQDIYGNPVEPDKLALNDAGFTIQKTP